MIREAIAQRPTLLLLLLCLWHLGFWVLAPALSYSMLPLDTLELLGWGREWQLGYYKHPPLGAWLGEAVLQLSGGRLEALYLFAQLLVVASFAYVYGVARLYLDPLRAVLAVALLEGSYFHTVLSPNFNMNSLQIPIWAGLSYHFLKALDTDAVRHWLAFGLFCALAVLAKYSGLLPIACCGLVLLLTARGRQRLAGRGPWLAALVALALLAPHLYWLTGHWQLPLDYLESFDRGETGLKAHLLEPLRFAAGSLAGLAPAALLWLLLRGRGAQAETRSGVPVPLLALCFGPLLLSMAYGALSGSHLKTTWAFPFYSLAGVLALLPLDRERVRRHLGRFLAALGALLLLTACLHLLYKTRWGDSKTRFDGPALARTVAAAWQEETGRPLRIVIGDHIDSAIVAAYAKDRPHMLIRGDFRISPWIAPADLERLGAVWLCRQPGPCPALRERTLRPRVIEVSGQRFVLAILPPAGASPGPPSPVAKEPS